MCLTNVILTLHLHPNLVSICGNPLAECAKRSHHPKENTFWISAHVQDLFLQINLGHFFPGTKKEPP